MTLVSVAFYRLKALTASKFTLMLMLVLPLVAALSAQAAPSLSAAVVPVAIVDLDRSQYSGWVTERLEKRSAVKAFRMDESEALQAVKSKRVEVAIIIDPGFAERVRSGEYSGSVRLVKSPASLSAEMVGEYLASEVVRLASNSMAAEMVVAEYERQGLVNADQRAQKWEEAWAYADGFWQPEPLMRLEYREEAAPGAAIASAAPRPSLAFFATLGSLVLFNVLLCCRWTVDDRESGVLRRVATTGTGRLTYLAGGALAALIVAGVTVGLAVVGARLTGASVGLGLWGAGVMGAYLLAATGLGVLCSGLLRTARQFQAAAPFLAIATGLVGAGLGSLAEVSNRFGLLALTTPQGWLLEGLRAASLGQPAIPAIAALCGAGVSTFLAGWWFSRP